MSAQPDPSLDSIVAEPIRLALWRKSTTGKGGLLPIADAFMEAANAEGGTFTPKSAWALVQALTATHGALGTLPRWVAAVFAEVLHLDPSSLHPEGAATPLRVVPHSERNQPCPTPSRFHPSRAPGSAIPAGKGSARTVMGADASATTTSRGWTGTQGNRDVAPSAGETGSHQPPADPPLASPALWWRSAACLGMDVDLFYADQGGSTADARAVCCVCPVRAQCLRYALVSPQSEQFGVWGGTNERQRRILKKHLDLPDAELLALADETSGGPPPESRRSKPILVPPSGEKRCRDCKGIFPLEGGFHRNGSNPDGRAYSCKSCTSRKRRETRRRQMEAAIVAIAAQARGAS